MTKKPAAWLPQTLRARLMLVMIPLIVLSISTAGYLVSVAGKDAILKEKHNHLLGVTRVLAAYLQAMGGFSSLEAGNGQLPEERKQRIENLNILLSPVTEQVASAFPGIGVGYYHRSLDAIVTYGPSSEHGKSVGVAIGEQHPGRKVMASGQADVVSGLQVRGEIMNAMTPVYEGEQVVGYIWANELLNDINEQLVRMRNTVFGLTALALLLALASISLVITRLTRDIEVIKSSLEHMGDNLDERIPQLQGEAGDVAVAVNAMAQSLSEAHRRERDAADSSLREKEDTLRAALEAIDEAFVMFDAEDRLVYCNEKYREVFQTSRDLLVPGKTFEEILRGGVARGQYPDALGDEEAWLTRRLAQHHSCDGFSEHQIDDGRWLRIIDRRTVNGHIVGFRIDITDLKMAKDLAEDANRIKSDFLANMSHEIRTPMNGVLGMTDLLLDTELNEEQVEYARTVSSSARALLGLINDILDFSKIEAGKLDVETIDFDLRVMVNEVTDLLALRANEKNIELTCLVDPVVPSLLRGDPGRIRQIMLNLVGNAIKFTHAGEVSIEINIAHEHDDQVSLYFSIRDTGIGIPADKLQHLFSPFTQADTSTTRKYGGTGLGLSIAKRLCELMGGSIGVRSEIGRGSTFWFELPFTLQGDAGSQVLSPSAMTLRGRRILIVDDCQTNRRLVEILLNDRQCTVLQAHDGASALHVLATEHLPGTPVDAIILDMQMPGMSGEETAAQIKAMPAFKDIPTILLTSMAMRGDAQRLTAAGFAAYLNKPIKDSLLYACLEALWSATPVDSLGQPSLITRRSLTEMTSRAKILLAEDNPTNQKLAQTLLKKLGHSVDVANDGQEALNRLAANAYDLVLMDCRMPVMGGHEATQLIRQGAGGVLNPKIPIIAMTANAMEGDREEALAVGMNDYLSKPIDPQQLAETIQRWTKCSKNDWREMSTVETSPVPKMLRPSNGRKLFDPARMLALLGDDMEIALMVLPDLTGSAQKELNTLKAAWLQGDVRLAERAAHTLKGLAATVCSDVVRDQAEVFERVAREQGISGLHDELPALEEATLQMNKLIRQWLDQQSR